MGFFYRTIRMVENDLKPCYVFDGKPPQLKSNVVRGGCLPNSDAMHTTTGRKGREAFKADCFGSILVAQEAFCRPCRGQGGRGGGQGDGYVARPVPVATRALGAIADGKADCLWLWLAGTAEDVDKMNRRQVKVTPQHNEDCRKLLTLMGIPWIVVSTILDRAGASFTRWLIITFVRHLRRHVKLRPSAPSCAGEDLYAWCCSDLPPPRTPH